MPRLLILFLINPRRLFLLFGHALDLALQSIPFPSQKVQPHGANFIKEYSAGLHTLIRYFSTMTPTCSRVDEKTYGNILTSNS